MDDSTDSPERLDAASPQQVAGAQQLEELRGVRTRIDELERLRFARPNRVQ